jgi:hypothetical protein
MAATAIPAVEHAPEATQPLSFDLSELIKMFDFTGIVLAVTGAPEFWAARARVRKPLVKSWPNRDME